MKKQKPQSFHVPNVTLSPFDVIVRDGKNPFSMAVGESNKMYFIQFYATGGSWRRGIEDRGMEHTSTKRVWSFEGRARIATGGTIGNLIHGDWGTIKGEFFEGEPGVDIQLTI